VMVASTLITWIVFNHLYATLPFYSDYTSPHGIFHLIISGFLAFNIYWNYISAILTSPGIPPSASDIFIGSLKDVNICSKCDKIKGERVHHCRVCNSCVMKMDHHCPWIANCVGERNQKFFVLFLLYLFVGCIYTSFMNLFPFLSAGDMSVPFEAKISRSLTIFSFALTLGCTLGIGLLFFMANIFNRYQSNEFRILYQ